MAPVKRKSASSDLPSDANNKRIKSERKPKPHSISSGKEEISPSAQSIKPTNASILVKEQAAFPRGGASILTPLERKQISARAARDVAAEQKQSNDLFGPGHAASDDSDLENLEEDGEKTETPKTKKKSKRAKAGAKAVAKEDSIPIEGLSYKRLAVGSLMLGRITSINTQDLTISLPNNLTGFVPLSEISNPYTEKIKTALADKEEDSNTDEEEIDDEDIALEAHFHPGQFIRVAVTSLGEEATGKSQAKRRINLSVEPRKCNVGLSASSLAVGCMVQAAVVSVEDHGLVVDLGLENDESVKGFIPSKSLDKSMPLSTVKQGAVLLCSITSVGSDGKVVKLASDIAKAQMLKNASTVDAFLPGTFVEVLVTETTVDGIAGKVMGLLDVTADIVHSGSYKDREAFFEKYKIGSKLKGRLICNFPLSEKKRLGFSILPDIVELSSSITSDSETLKTSSIVSSARIVRVVSGLGIYLALPSGQTGFAHISRLSDKKVESVSETTGPYKLNSKHNARILDYNSVDGLYILSLQKKVIEQRYLRVDDVQVGDQVKATIEKVLIGPAGVTGLILGLAEGVTGLVTVLHMSDIALLHPEKKFREGATVNARVLSVDVSKRQIRLTLKKTLVNSDQKIWSDFHKVSVEDSTVGTLVKVDRQGALVQFYGSVRGFLPVSEMSEAYIKDATEHFKIGQVLTVSAISVNSEENRLTLSCRDRSASTENALALVVPGSLVSGIVFEKSQNDLLMRLEGSDVIARLPLDHVSDGSERKRKSALEKLRVGQRLEDVLVLEVQRKGRLVNLSNKQSLVKAAQSGQFLKSFVDLREGAMVTGFISNITGDGVFVRFAHGITGLITKRQVPVESEELPEFGMQVLQAITSKVITIDNRGATPRFWLTMRESAQHKAEAEPIVEATPAEMPEIINPVDETISAYGELVTGKTTKARITSIKDTQINVELAKDVHGRIDVSEVFDDWEAIKDRKQPLQIFSAKQIIPVRVLGAHDTRNHRFLPLSHRTGKNTVFELSAKPSVVNAQELKTLSLSEMEQGSSWLAYVNNIVDNYLMVNVTPAIRGRIRAIDVSDDLSLAADLETNFPVGSAIRVRVLAVDPEKNYLDLTGKSDASSTILDLQDLTAGMIMPGRVTKVSDRSILVQLSDKLVGAVELIDMADDYTQSNTAKYQKNDIIRVCVLRVDIPNKKVILSTRPSKVLSSTLKVTDPEITAIQQLNINDVIRGFTSNITDKGVFVTVGHGVTALVRVTNLSDSFLKNWKDNYQRDQLVKGKVIAVDKSSGHLQLSLKESVLSGEYKPRRTFADMHKDELVTGKIVKVETFGVFILVDNSENVRGLCHRSEIADNKVQDASKLFNEGDVVKAKVLKIDLPNRRINFGMKASYFSDANEDEEMLDVDEQSEDEEDESSNSDGGLDITAMSAASEATGTDQEISDESENEEDSEDDDAGNANESSIMNGVKNQSGLSVGGFDWYGMATSDSTTKRHAESEARDSPKDSKKRKKRAEIQVDRTGDLDANGPQSTDDFERLLLGEPDSSMLWLQYMAFHLELGDIDAARAVGERALKTIGLGQDTEKLNVWIALLNLENAYGDDESMDGIFKRACEYNDAQEIYNRLGSIYIQSGKHKKADDLFQESLKKFTQDPKVYVNYATFLFDTVGDADKGRALLSRALQILPPFTHFDITSKFAQLEFKSSAGLAERGRTIFEGLVNSFPKRVDLFNIMLDMEMSHGETDGDSKEQIRGLFERILQKKLKPKQAKHFFKRWLAYEEEIGDERKIEEVKARAATWVKQSSQA